MTWFIISGSTATKMRCFKSFPVIWKKKRGGGQNCERQQHNEALLRRRWKTVFCLHLYLEANVSLSLWLIKADLVCQILEVAHNSWKCPFGHGFYWQLWCVTPLQLCSLTGRVIFICFFWENIWPVSIGKVQQLNLLHFLCFIGLSLIYLRACFDSFISLRAINTDLVQISGSSLLAQSQVSSCPV